MESPCWTDDVPDTKEASAPRGNPAEFRRKVLDLVDSGREIREIAHGLGISEQTICVWRPQHLVDTGQLPGPTSQDRAELVVARRRIAEPEAELAVRRRRRHSVLGMLPPVEFELKSIPAIARTPATRLHASRDTSGVDRVQRMRSRCSLRPRREVTPPQMVGVSSTIGL
ncbi:transposase [Streptomyces sp. NPDC005009]